MRARNISVRRAPSPAEGRKHAMRALQWAATTLARGESTGGPRRNLRSQIDFTWGTAKPVDNYQIDLAYGFVGCVVVIHHPGIRRAVGATMACHADGSPVWTAPEIARSLGVSERQLSRMVQLGLDHVWSRHPIWIDLLAAAN